MHLKITIPYRTIPYRTVPYRNCTLNVFLFNVKNLNDCKGKGKIRPRTIHEGPEAENRYRSTLSLTSTLDGEGGHRYTPAALPPGKTRYPLYRRLGGSKGRYGRAQEISPPPGFDPRTVQPVASRYTD
jgi:hypothetical protein